MRCFDHAIREWARNRHATIEMLEYTYFVEGVRNKPMRRSLSKLCQRWNRTPEWVSKGMFAVEMLIGVGSDGDYSPIGLSFAQEEHAEAQAAAKASANDDEIPF